MSTAVEQIAARALDVLPAIREAAITEWRAHRATKPGPKPTHRAEFLVGYVRGWFARNAQLLEETPVTETPRRMSTGASQLFTSAMVNHGRDARAVVEEWHSEAGHAGTVWSCHEQPCHAVEAVSR